MLQDPKYALSAVNRATGRMIPQHIPLMLFSARDLLAVVAVEAYVTACKRAGVSPEQLASADERLQAFIDFANDHANEMKLPGNPPGTPPDETAALTDFPVAIDQHYTYWLSGGNVVQFVKPDTDGTLLAGTTTEEVLAMLIDRVAAQNKLCASEEHKHTLAYLTAALGTQTLRMAMNDLAVTSAPEKFGIVMHPCKSSNLDSYGYNAAKQTLALEFKSKTSDGKTRFYHYKAVPEAVYDGLIEAASPGGYAAAHIIGKFEGVAMEEPVGAAA